MQGLIVSLLAGSLWGTVPIVTKIALQELSPFEISFYRALLAYLFLSPFFLVTKRSRFLIPKRESLPYIVALGFFGVGIFWTFINVGLVYTKAIRGAFLMTVYPALVPLFAPFFLGEKTSGREYLGAILAIGGTYLLISKGHWIPPFTIETIWGDLLSFSASLSFTAYLLLQRKWGWKFSHEYSTVNMMGFGIVFHLMIIFVVSSPLRLWHTSLRAFGAVLWLAIGCSALPFLLVNKSLKSSRATPTAISLIMSPLVGFFSCLLILGETLTFSGILGGILIVGGILIAGVWAKRKKHQISKVMNGQD
jgi:drug/metabolite transporter (DMT)-like permease